MGVIRILWSDGLGQLYKQKFAYLAEIFLFQMTCLPKGKGWQPPVDIFEIPQGLIVTVNCPGADRNLFEIRLDGTFLYIRGYRSVPLKQGRVYQLEGEYGPFERLIRLPFSVTDEGAEAVFEDGLLKIFLPKQRH
ncbi:hypothetical protein Thein_1310 [Thermodesulfatator indicus DSM 15286]|uniref:SHSP domain-containing protein n=1 Tax=Thermodesulfatator indicus (strain DSM 15286 / JCM 11887 / CIR29812) TaxID=667014 RepID=F8A949_THEID|nr:Hsp20 family protein [Thermodesulfatator indicus]AEH45177.1 hypothetical protein Thein_1310 [Thermodesulfatator indicus DSM 15286]